MVQEIQKYLLIAVGSIAYIAKFFGLGISFKFASSTHINSINLKRISILNFYLNSLSNHKNLVNPGDIIYR